MSPESIRVFADYARDNGAHAKAEMLDGLADEVELYRPVLIAVWEEFWMGEYDRDRVEERIREIDDVDAGGSAGPEVRTIGDGPPPDENVKN